MEPLVSFIIPARDAAGTIGECLRSIFIQTGAPFEVIVVDDSSVDALQDAVSDFDCIYLRVEKRNRGAARNAGVRISKGLLLAFVDADTVLRAGWLEVLLSELCDPAVGGAQGAIDYRDSGGAVVSRNVAVSFLYLPFLHTAACLVRKDRFVDYGLFDERLRRHEDVDYGISLCFRSIPVVFTDRTGADTRATPGLRFFSQFDFGWGLAQLISKWREHLPDHGSLESRLARRFFLVNFFTEPGVSPILAAARRAIQAASFLAGSARYALRPYNPAGIELEEAPAVRWPLDGRQLSWLAGVRFYRVPGSIECLNTRTRKKVSITGTFPEFYSLLAENGWDFAAALSLLKAKYPNDAETIERDFEAVGRELSREGMIG